MKEMETEPERIRPDVRFKDFITVKPEVFRRWLEENNEKARKNKYWKSITV